MDSFSQHAQHGLRAWIVQQPQAKSQRVQTARMGNFVHEAFGRKHIAMRTQSPHGRAAQRHAQEPVRHHLHMLAAVRRHRVALSACARGCGHVDWLQRRKWLGGLPTAQQRGCGRATGARAVALAPDLMLPIGEFMIGIELGRDTHAHGRRQW